MFLTNALLKKAKSKMVLVMAKSVVTGYQKTRIRERIADKVEFIDFDPLVQQKVLFREKKKLHGIY